MSYDTNDNPAELYGKDGKIYYRKAGTAGVEIDAGGASGAYLPLTAGSEYPLTGDLYINKTNPCLNIKPTDTTFPTLYLRDSADNILGDVHTNTVDMFMVSSNDLYMGTTVTTGGDIMLVPKGNTRLTIADTVITSAVELAMGNNKITGLGAGDASSTDAARMVDLDDYLPLDGSKAMTGSLDMGDNKIKNIDWLDAYDSYGIKLHGSSGSQLGILCSEGTSDYALWCTNGGIYMGGRKIEGLGAGDASSTDAARMVDLDNIAGTNNTSFIIDQDNTGPEVCTSVRFNRGESGGDARIIWDVDDCEFQFEEQESYSWAKINAQLIKMTSEPTNHKTGTIQMNDSTGDMELKVSTGCSVKIVVG